MTNAYVSRIVIFHVLFAADVEDDNVRIITAYVILKGLPVLQCDSCSEYLLDDPVPKRVEKILEKADTVAELEVIRYAA